MPEFKRLFCVAFEPYVVTVDRYGNVNIRCGENFIWIHKRYVSELRNVLTEYLESVSK